MWAWKSQFCLSRLFEFLFVFISRVICVQKEQEHKERKRANILVWSGGFVVSQQYNTVSFSTSGSITMQSDLQKSH